MTHKQFIATNLPTWEKNITKTHTTMKSHTILTLLILGSALLHVGPIALVALLACAFIPLTHTSVALVLLGLLLNTLALVRLHVWNGSFN